MSTRFCFVHQVNTLLQRTDHSFLLYIVFVSYIYMCACLCVTAGIASTVRVLAVRCYSRRYVIYLHLPKSQGLVKVGGSLLVQSFLLIYGFEDKQCIPFYVLSLDPWTRR